jgi:PilZ domain
MSDGEESWAQRRLAQRGLARAAAEAGGEAPDGGAPEQRAADRRREARQTGPASRARVAFRGREHEVALLNLSRRGTMIGSDVGARAGDRIAIQFPECNPVHGVVRWVEDGRTGIEFANQTALLVPAHWRVGGRRGSEAATGGEARSRPPRHKLLWECELYWGRGNDRARVRNISAEGAMIDGSRNVPVGTEVVLALRSAGTVSGTVKWSRSGQVGIQFQRPFDIRKVLAPAGINAQAGSSPDRPGMLKPLYLESELDPSSPWAARQDKLRPQDLQP